MAAVGPGRGAGGSRARRPGGRLRAGSSPGRLPTGCPLTLVSLPRPCPAGGSPRDELVSSTPSVADVDRRAPDARLVVAGLSDAVRAPHLHAVLDTGHRGRRLRPCCAAVLHPSARPGAAHRRHHDAAGRWGSGPPPPRSARSGAAGADRPSGRTPWRRLDDADRAAQAQRRLVAPFFLILIFSQIGLYALAVAGDPQGLGPAARPVPHRHPLVGAGLRRRPRRHLPRQHVPVVAGGPPAAGGHRRGRGVRPGDRGAGRARTVAPLPRRARSGVVAAVTAIVLGRRRDDRFAAAGDQPRRLHPAGRRPVLRLRQRGLRALRHLRADRRRAAWPTTCCRAPPAGSPSACRRSRWGSPPWSSTARRSGAATSAASSAWCPGSSPSASCSPGAASASGGSLLAGAALGHRGLGWWAPTTTAAPASSRTHLGRFVAEVLAGEAGNTLRRKAAANLDLLTSSPLTLLVPFAVAFLTLVLLRPALSRAPALARTFDRSPAFRAGLLAVLLTSVVGFAHQRLRHRDPQPGHDDRNPARGGRQRRDRAPGRGPRGLACAGADDPPGGPP